MAPPAAGQKASKAKNEGLKDLLLQCWGDYTTETPGRLKLIDSYLVFVLLTGVVQFVYCALVGTFPFNSFLAGFISCIASFVLAVALRMQVSYLVFNFKTDYLSSSELDVSRSSIQSAPMGWLCLVF